MSFFSLKILFTNELLGYKALKLIYNHDYKFILQLPKNIWQKWSSFILLSLPNKSEQSKSDRDLIDLAYNSDIEYLV